MNRIFITLLTLGLAGLSPVILAGESADKGQLSLHQLEQRLVNIDRERDQLAHTTLRSGVGNLGWISQKTPQQDATEWIQINLNKEAPVDLVVLVPILWNDAQNGPRADGFPLEFKIIIGNHDHPDGFTAATFSEEDRLLPRLAPLQIPLPPTSASWLRIEATKLSSWAWAPDFYVFQLAEVMLFDGPDNIALNQSVETSSGQKNYVAKAMYKAALVDGITPYLMDAATGDQSDPCMLFFRQKQTPAITIDLGQTYPVNSILLHTADLRENIPKIHHADYGLPRNMLIEGANRPDFSDAVPLMEYHREQVYEAGPIIPFNFPETDCRYIRFNARESYAAPEAGGIWRCLGFAEIEILSNGKNVAKGKRAEISIEARITQGMMANLTDGRNHYGDILPLRTWMEQLARRHTLQQERPVIAAEINRRYAQQETNLKRLTWLAAVLVTIIVLTVLLESYLHRRNVRRLKERFAADLHDELGANLHTIGLLSDMAEKALSAPAQLSDYLQRIRAVTERSGKAIRYVTGLNDSPQLFTGLKTDMQRAAERIVDQLEQELIIEGEEYLQSIKQRTRIDLFLFYKECLINICRHSGATRLKTHLVISPQHIKLSITDNGYGLPESMSNGIPKSLKRRARLLRAKIEIDHAEEAGTQIHLSLRIFRNRRLRKG